MPLISPAKFSQPSLSAGYAKSASESAHPELWDGLVGAWMPSFGATGGTLRDVSRNSNHGTLTNMDPATDWVTSEKGLTLDFDGTDDYITCGDVHDALERFTLSIWFKSADGSQTNKGLFGRWGSNETANSGYMLWLSLTGRLSLPINAATHAEGTTDIRTGGWRHLVGTFDGVNGKIFVDGKLEQSFTDATPNTSSSDFLIGAYKNNSGIFEEVAGTLSFATLYDRALSPQEIKQLYVDSFAPFRQRRRVITSTQAAPAFNNWYALPGRKHRIIGSGVHV